MLDILIIITLSFIALNFFITNGDFFHPSTAFCEIFGIYEIVCAIIGIKYNFEIHLNTILVLSSGMLIFTLFALVTQLKDKKSKAIQQTYKLQYIEINRIIVIGVMLVQLLVIYLYIKYLKQLFIAYTGHAGTLIETIGAHNTFVKFDYDVITSLGIQPSKIYKIFSPICNACAYVFLFIIINNYLAAKKREITLTCSFLFMCCSVYLSLGRMAIIQALIAMVIMVYILKGKQNGFSRGRWKMLFKVTLLLIAVVIVFVLSTQFLGRENNEINLSSFFDYIGAPIINLDSFLQTDFKLSTLFGDQTFRNLYNSIGNKIGMPQWVYPLDLPSYGWYKDLWMGNVYTTYYPFIRDFGYIGIFPLILLMAIYYIFTYKKIKNKKFSYKSLSFVIVVYSYLFGDLVLSAFSNRFYENVVTLDFIKFLIYLYIGYLIFIYQKTKQQYS